MAVDERRAVGVLTREDQLKLRKAIQVFHARNPGQRVAMQYVKDGSVNVWRLR